MLVGWEFVEQLGGLLFRGEAFMVPHTEICCSLLRPGAIFTAPG
jgi:hypothetical protein